MKVEKLEKIDKEIAALDVKIKELQKKLYVLKEKRKEEENLYIIKTVRNSKISMDELINAVKYIKNTDLPTENKDKIESNTDKKFNLERNYSK